MKKISIVISVYNEEENLKQLYSEFIKYKLDNFMYEYIFVNDGSKDRSLLIINELCKLNKEVKLIDFTRNYGHEIAMTAGMDMATGDTVIFMDADLQHPVEIINEMIQIWSNYNKRIVLTKRAENKANSWTYKVLSSLYYRILNYLSDYDMQSNTPDFRLIDRYYIDILKQYKENSRLFRGLLYLINAKDDTETIEFIAPKRFAGESKYNFLKLFNLAIDSILAFSIKPLRIALVFSSFIFLFAMLYGIFILIGTIVGFIDVNGLATQVLMTIILGSGNLLVLSIIGEYVGRIHIESKNRPLYTIKRLGNFNE